MRRHRFSRDQLRRDDGVSLILALIFVFIVGILVAALLPYTSTGINAAAAVQDVRSTQNAVDGAVDQAINSIRQSLVLGTKPLCTADPSTYPTYTAPDYPPAGSGPAGVRAAETTQVTVSYCDDASSTNPTDQPPFAIQTLQGDVVVIGNAPLVVAGGILSSHDVTSTSGAGGQESVNVIGDLYAIGNCSARAFLFVSGVEHCANTPPDPNNPNVGLYSGPPSGSDPDPHVDPFSPTGVTPVSDPFSSLPSTVDPLGTCKNSSSVVTFVPGFYSQSPQPDPASCTGNGHSVWWFKPGLYYFDFPDSTFKSTQFGDFKDTDAQFAYGQGVSVIGGTPNYSKWGLAPGSQDLTSAESADSGVITNLYKNDPDHANAGCDSSQPGVLFGFAGPTFASIQGGNQDINRMEICAAVVPGSSQQVSLFGLRSGTARTNTATQGTLTVTPTSNKTSAAIDVYTPASAAASVNGLSATAALSGDGPKTGTLTYANFGNFSPAIPDGSLITSAQLHVAWSTGGLNASKVANTLSYTSDVFTPATAISLGSGNSGNKTFPLALTNTVPRWRALQNALKNLSLTFTADGSSLSPTTVDKKGNVTPAQTATSSVDGVQLEVSYIPPALEPVRCVGATGTTPTCNIVTNTVDDTVFLHGTVYTPKSSLEVAIHNYSSTVFERGVIAASLKADVSASTKQTLPPFQLPGASSKRIVRFFASARTQNPDGTWGAWRTRLVALVQYVDVIQRATGKTTVSPGHVVIVKEWTVMR